ncbi:hypothetical protein GUITHDRAFT_64796 [Guillardia theta CCMP2712]|uniref:Thymidylate kinase n=2 Tax=Guillardia theta TaxID=55529 RepID=L1JWU7_GUITC|nr:hypothetical protein GUITHDRAFT_64796 [Guillardia theta CCMP2712]EKX53061.1 hypothetical protein GUITHDRAFT_64796 [Guillardia theta CCMP2712]|eukprot:XP_005840041.1 hypothetical protein GUITHDRAFT_64796 [Guillardia theta CCMP2712]
MGGRGALIVLEGLDRSGKSTQVIRLVEKLVSMGKKASKMNFPDRTTTVGGLINEYLQSGKDLDDAVIHLLFSANRWEATRSIRDRLSSGETLIVDRYAYSGVAFSAAKGTLDIEWCKGPDRGLPAPDCVIYLDVSSDVAKQRGGYGEERYEKEEFQKKVRTCFEALMSQEPAMWRRVDANKTMDEVTEEIEGIATKIVDQVTDKPIGSLWTK